MNFRLAHDEAVLLETVANLLASWSEANNFFAVFSSFELGGITKHLMTGTKGINEFFSPRPQCFPWLCLRKH